MKRSRKLSAIIIHCSATRPSQDIGKAEIEAWHKTRGFASVGYHFIIRRNGHIEHGRDINITGAHCKGHNKGTIGICMVGGVTEENVNTCENNFNPEQFNSLKKLLGDLIQEYPTLQSIKGHNNYTATDCPSFDVESWLEKHNITA